MTASATCPFCNTVVAFDVAGLRQVCSRCGESFVPTADSAATTADSAATTAEPTAAIARPPSWKAFAVPGAVGLLLFLGVFTFGLKAILWPNANRTAAATEAASNATPKRTSLWPPGALSGMKYVAPTAELVFAVQPAAFADYAAREGKDPVELLAKYGVPKPLWEAVAALGFRFEDVSQIVAGLTPADDGLFPHGVLALILRKPPADEAAFFKAIKAEPTPGVAGRYRVTVRNLPLVMKREEAATYLFAFDVADLNLAVAAPGLGHLSPSLRTSLDKLSPSSFAWLAMDERDWIKKPLFALIAKSEYAAKFPKLFDLRAVALGLSLEPQPRLTVAEKHAGAEWTTTEKAAE